MIFSLFSLHARAYTKSEFGFTGTDTVQVQECDSFEIIKVVPKPKNVKHIKEAKIVDPPIPDDAYSWPGHRGTATVADMDKERNFIYSHFEKKTDLTQDKCYYHPAGIKQFYGDEQLINNAPRYKIRVYINTRYSDKHWTAIYAPPGELITIEIPPSAVGKIGVLFNHHINDNSNYHNRMRTLKSYTTLNREVNNVSWPFGGAITITCGIDRFNQGLEVTITGGIRMPYFRYGYTTDQEWEEELSLLPGPIANFDMGNALAQLPSTKIRGKIKMNDAGAFWRSASRNLYSVTELHGGARRRDGRIMYPNQWTFDSYVPFGEAATAYGGNRIVFPPHWADGIVSYDSAKWGCWGQLHEYGHNFQHNWGFPNFRAYCEVTNNVLNLITYSRQIMVDSRRQMTMGRNYIVGIQHGGHGETTHQFSLIKRNDIFSFYANFLYYFGTDKFRKFLNAHIQDKLYKRSEYPYISQFLLTACDIYKRDFRDYFKTFTNVFNYNDPGNIVPKVDEILNQRNYSKFNPVAIVYQTGYIVDGDEFQTANPFEIPAKAPYVFEFQRNSRYRDNMAIFMYDGCDNNGTIGTIEPIGMKAIKYTPPSDQSIVDRFVINYSNFKDGNDIVQAVIKVKQIFDGARVTFYPKVDNIDDQETVYKKAMARQLTRSTPYTLIERSGIIVPQFSTDQQECPWFATVDGMFVPKVSGKFKFVMSCNDKGMFYLSENNLSYDPEADKQYLLNKKDSYTEISHTQDATPIYLEANKKYYYRFTIFNKKDTGGGRIAYVFNDEQAIKHIRTDWLFQTNCGPEDVDQVPFKPIIENDPTLGIYYEDRYIKQMRKDTWKVTSSPHVRNSRSNLSVLLFNKAYGNEDTACDGSYPHTYSVDFGEPVSFDQLYIPTRRDNLMTSNVEISCDSTKVLNSSFTTENPLLKFDNIQKCTKLDIKILNNGRGTWSSLVEIEPRLLSSTSRNIIPSTHTKLRLVGRGELTRKGLYYNGRGFHVKKSAMLQLKLKLNETGDSFAIVGDKFERGGRFKVYIDGELDQVVDTNVITPEERSKMAARRIYQVVLYGKRNLTPNSEHLIVLKVVRGEIGIAGFLADGNLTELPSEDVAKRGVLEGDEEEELPGDEPEEEEEAVITVDEHDDDTSVFEDSMNGNETQILGVNNGGETGNATEGAESFQSETEDQKEEREREEERKRQEQLQKVKEEADRVAREEEERLRKQQEEEEIQRKKQEEEEKKRKQEEDERKKQEEEKKRKQEEDERKKQEEEKKRKEEEDERKRQEEEKKKQDEEKKKQEEEKKKQDEEEKKKNKDNESGSNSSSTATFTKPLDEAQSQRKAIIIASSTAGVVVLAICAGVAAVFITKAIKHKDYHSEGSDGGIVV